MRIILIFLLTTSVCWADLPINEKYSNRAFPYHGVFFKDRPAEEFNNTTIRNTCFYQEWVEGDEEVVKDIFPDGISGVVFKNCNLDNIYVPPGNVAIDCLQRKIQVQNDWEDWILDNSLKPVEPMNKEERIEKCISIDPKNIPAEKFTEEEKENFDANFNIAFD